MKLLGLSLPAVLLVAGSLSAGPGTEVEQLYSEAVEQMRKGRLDEASASFLRLATLAPQLPEPYLYLGKIFLAQNSPTRAAEMLKKAIQLKPSSSEAHHGLGISYLKQQLYRPAETALRNAVRLAPNDPVIHLDLGHAYLNSKQQAAAIREFEKVITLHPQNVTVAFAAHFNLGLAFQGEQRLEDALRQFAAARRLVPSNLEAQYSLCEVYLQLGRTDEAVTAVKGLTALAAREALLLPRIMNLLLEHKKYEELVQLLEELRPDLSASPVLFRGLAIGYSALGRIPDAIRSLEQILVMEKAAASDYFDLAKLYSSQKDSRSIRLLRKYVELQPNDDEAWETLGVELERLNQLRLEAVEIFKMYANLYPKKVQAHLLLGKAYFNAGSIDQSVEHFEKALQLDSKSPRALIALGQAYKFMGDLEKAQDFCEKAVHADSRNIPAYLELGEIRSLQGSHVEAISLIRKAVEFQPALPEPHIRLGKALLGAKRYQEARETLETAVRLNSTSLQAHFFLAKAYQGLQDSGAAQKAYERFKELETRSTAQKETGPPAPASQ